MASIDGRVPAWKKIGLKLKHASEHVPEVKTISAQDGFSGYESNCKQQAISAEPSSETTLAIRSPKGKSGAPEAKKSKKRKAAEDDANDQLISTNAEGVSSSEHTSPSKTYVHTQNQPLLVTILDLPRPVDIIAAVRLV